MPDEAKDSYGILFDVERCVGCNACAMACKAEFGWPEGHFIVRVEPVEQGVFPAVKKNFVRKACMHCSEAACMMACPVSAIKREPEHYGLNRDPKVPLSVIVWKQFIQPIGTYGIIGAVLAAMAHYFIIGPKKEKRSEVKGNE